MVKIRLFDKPTAFEILAIKSITLIESGFSYEVYMAIKEHRQNLKSKESKYLLFLMLLVFSSFALANNFNIQYNPYSDLDTPIEIENNTVVSVTLDNVGSVEASLHLGNYTFDKSSQQGIVLSDSADGYVIADAIKLVLNENNV